MEEKSYTKFKGALEAFFPFEASPTIAVAVSGGSDSLALMLLCKKWIGENSGKLIALTVDHKLREDSGNEADYVKSLCESNNIEHYTLKWEHGYINSNIQEQAREARYKLLTEFCNNYNILHIFTGHHTRDEIENFFMRLTKGSGIIGLSRHDTRFVNNIRIIKPLKDFSKLEISSIVTNIKHIEDPSNSADKFLRSRVRKSFEGFLNNIAISKSDKSFCEKNIKTSINHLAFPAKLYENALVEFLALACEISPYGFAKLERQVVEKYDKEIIVFALSHLLITISGKNYLPRAQGVENLYLKLKQSTPTKITLHGCVIKCDHEILIYREFGKSPPNSVAFQKNIKWDNRFCVSRDIFNPNLMVDYIRKKEFQEIRKQVKSGNNIPKEIIFTLPVIRDIEKLIAIPHINYYSNYAWEPEFGKEVPFVFKPDFLSRLVHY